MHYEIDATGKKLGRLATEVAVKLMGKDKATFVRNNIEASNTVKVTNAAKLSVTPVKMLTKKYVTYSGYPGGQKVETLGKVASTKGMSEAVRKAVKGMLPDNKLKNKMMKQLTVTE